MTGFYLQPDDFAADDSFVPVAGYWTRADIVAMNLAFADAMLAARKRGLEHFSLGPVVDDSAFFPQHFEVAPRLSYISSSAALCDEASDAGHMAATRP